MPHAATDGTTWTLVPGFTLGDGLAEQQIGFEVQSPTGDGCDVTFEEIHFTDRTLHDLRDGS